ncbi:MAG: LysR family transcriptional regulator [Roseibium sp.]|uniref:LysR family transcriptional regulator n=1 Tax=Roseibium sp. TaxID=1936156 RepID=UPI001B0EB03C|nr:LysR family transcriptional regulator [Roseibium sp.]MBO6894225.1 LysR family transcriptional regulator [Roseibium sp.]MBO6928863.1 LysR family transcriptional regulator [Roseibium sp.]
MHWDHLRAFLTFIREGSVRRAARTLNTTHSTVARQLKALEADLGGPLFEPGPEGRTLTALGHRIVPMAERMEADAAAISRAAFAEDTSLAGPVCLSVTEGLYLNVFAPVIDDFLRHFPMITLELVMSDALSSLSRREADVVIRITNTPPDSAIGRKLAASPICPYVAPKYLVERPRLDRWIALDYEPARAPVLPAHVVATASSLQSAAHLIRAGQGIGILPCFQGDTDPGLIRLPGHSPLPDMDIWILTHTDLKTNARVRALLDHIYNAVPEFAPIISGTEIA